MPPVLCPVCDGDGKSISLADPCSSCKGTGFDTEYTDAPVCPHCGAEQSTDDLHQDTELLDCADCGEMFDVGVNYEVTYSTTKSDPVKVQALKDSWAEARRRRAEYESGRTS